MDAVTIVGTGAMALYFGSRLAGAGIQVRLLADLNRKLVV